MAEKYEAHEYSKQDFIQDWLQKTQSLQMVIKTHLVDSIPQIISESDYVYPETDVKRQYEAWKIKHGPQK